MSLVPFIFQEAGMAAGGAGAPAQPSMLVQMLPFAAILVIFYFLLIRPQQKRQKEHANMLGALKKGDAVVTTGGLIGKIVRIDDNEVVLDAGEGVKLRVVRSMIVDVHGKTQPAPANDAKAV